MRECHGFPHCQILHAVNSHLKARTSVRDGRVMFKQNMARRAVPWVNIPGAVSRMNVTRSGQRGRTNSHAGRGNREGGALFAPERNSGQRSAPAGECTSFGRFRGFGRGRARCDDAVELPG